MTTTASVPRPLDGADSDRPGRTRSLSDPAYQAFLLLRVGFAVAPILFGLEKFVDWLVEWELYLAPAIDDLIPGDAHDAMLIVGLVEVAAGVVVALRPRFGGYLVAAWLVAIIANLVLLGEHLDIALRDAGLALGALTLARLAVAFEDPVGTRPITA